MEYGEWNAVDIERRKKRYVAHTTANLLGEIQTIAFQVRMQNMAFQEQIDDRIRELRRRIGDYK